MSVVAKEYNASKPIKLSSFYAGNGFVPAGANRSATANQALLDGLAVNQVVPLSGKISIANLYGTESIYTFAVTLDSQTLGESSGTISKSATYTANTLISNGYRMIAITVGNFYLNCRGGSASMNITSSITYPNSSSTSSSYGGNRYMVFKLFVLRDGELYYYDCVDYGFPTGASSIPKYYIRESSLQKVQQVTISDVVSQSKGGPCYGGMGSSRLEVAYK